MQATRLFMKINSENIHIPELRQFIGKIVEIVIIGEPTPLNEKKDGKMERFFSAAGKIEIDENVIWQLREESNQTFLFERKVWLLFLKPYLILNISI